MLHRDFTWYQFASFDDIFILYNQVIISKLGLYNLQVHRSFFPTSNAAIPSKVNIVPFHTSPVMSLAYVGQSHIQV